MKAQSLWIPKGIIILWLYFKFSIASLDEEDQVCVETHLNGTKEVACYEYGSASFGDLIESGTYIRGVVVLAEPRTACTKVKPQSSYNSSGYSGSWFLLIDYKLGECAFDTKGYRATQGGFDAAIIRSLDSNGVRQMEGSTKDYNKVHIPVVYVGKLTGEVLESNDFIGHPDSRIDITAQTTPIWDYKFYMIPFAIIVGICFILMAMFMISRYYRHYLEQRRNRLSPTNLRKIPTKKFKKGDDYYDVCAICLEEYKDGERLRILPCEHAYHCKCVDPWLTEGKRICPVCKRPVTNDRRSQNRTNRTDVEAGSGETTHDDADETTPLIGSTSASVNSLTV